MLSRRQFLKGSVAVAAAGIIADSVFYEPKRFVVEKKTIAIRNLPIEFEGFRICQLSDIHHSLFVGLKFIERVADEVYRLNADLIALTGDYVAGSYKYIPPVIDVLGKFKAPHGVYAVLGNHDHYEGAELTQDVLSKYHIPVLRNMHKMIGIKNKALCIGGVGDYQEDQPDVSTAFSGVDSDIPRILLSHNPDYAEIMPKTERVDLMLSGHTHGGQIKIPFTIAPMTGSEFGQKYIGGLVRLADTQIYVSRGIGVVLLPIRFNCNPEVTLITLTNDKIKA